jgi:hypothetical protein
MKKGIIIFLSLLFFGCGESAKKFPYELVNSKPELKDENVLEVYSLTGAFNIEEFKEFCLIKKGKFELAGFYKIVLFDKKENVFLTKAPVTSAYQLLDEIESRSHIIGEYTYGKFNGFSELVITVNGKSETLKL